MQSAEGDHEIWYSQRTDKRFVVPVKRLVVRCSVMYVGVHCVYEYGQKRRAAMARSIPVTPARPAAVDLHSRKARESLAHTVTQLFDRWHLAASDQAVLLGLSPESRTALSRYRRGGALPDSEDLLARVGHLIAIHDALRIMFPYNPELAYAWVATPNTNFGGLTPLAYMRANGFLGVAKVRRYLDFERGR